MAMAGKRLTALEMPDEEDVALPTSTTPSVIVPPPVLEPAQSQVLEYQPPPSIPLPPIPAAPVRRVMVQLSIKAPIALVERLEAMASRTGAQKQAVIAAALDAYMRGHGY